MEGLTKFQAFALDLMPRGKWFRAFELPLIVRRPVFTCKLLTEKGYLEERLSTEPLCFEYRVKE